ncbi:MAG: dihydrodipicolinate synthase family protein [Bacteroidales bacterium]|nr:dihydrodipicolinate synthase family protein [Bacteroidales bacterium]
MEHNKLEGIIPAVFTPMNADYSLNTGLIEHLAKVLTKNGVSGFFVAGTTGETTSLTLEERMELAEVWRSHTPSGMKLIIHVGHNCLSDAQKLARHAASIKADDISAFPPSYYKPLRMEELVNYCKAIADSGNGLPFYYYHIPFLTGVHVKMHDFIRTAKTNIPHFTGIKFTNNDLMDYRLASTYGKNKYNMLCGLDEMLLPAMTMGAKGAVGGTYNFAAPLYIQIIKAYENNNIETAQALQDKSIQMIQILQQYGGAITAGKSIMKMLGIDCGPCRLPLRTLTRKDEETLQKELDDISFFQYAIK